MNNAHSEAYTASPDTTHQILDTQLISTTLQHNSDSGSMMQPLAILLAGLGLVALASSAPADTGNTRSPNSFTTFWENTQTQKYHCEGKDVIRCETIAEGTCIAIPSCETYCFLHDNGAACVAMDEPPVTPKTPMPSSEAKIVGRDSLSQENEHKECSKDRTGVLICRYGFCSTDHYCKAGDECEDGSFSCAHKFLSAPKVKSEVRDMPPQAQVAALDLEEKPSYKCSRDRASVLKCFYGFCSTDYYCAKRHPCIDTPARCKEAPSAQTEQ